MGKQSDSFRLEIRAWFWFFFWSFWLTSLSGQALADPEKTTTLRAGDACGVVMTSMMPPGDRTHADIASRSSIVAFDYSLRGAESTTPDPVELASAAEVGSVWGKAYATNTHMLYASSFLRRHADLSPDGLGAIYRIDVSNVSDSSIAGNPELWMDLNTTTHLGAGATLFPHETAANRGLGGAYSPSHDVWAYNRVGKEGIGGLAISTDNSTLYAMDMTNRQLLQIDINAKTVSNRYTVNDPGCAGGAGDVRPFGVDYLQGNVYIGVTCSGETTEDPLDVDAYVMKLDGGTFTTVVSGAKGYKWSHEWSSNVYGSGGSCASPKSNGFVPLITNMQLDENGNMMIGATSVNGWRWGNRNYTADSACSTLTNSHESYGYIMHATPSGAVWNLASTEVYDTGTKQHRYKDGQYVHWGPTGANHTFIGGMDTTSCSGQEVSIVNLMETIAHESAGTRFMRTSDAQHETAAFVGDTALATSTASTYEHYRGIGTTWEKSSALGDIEFIERSDNAFSCTDDLYQSSNQNLADTNEMGLYKINRATVPYNLDLIGSVHNTTYNALAYRTQDNYLYALYYNELLKIGSNGTPQSLGTVTGLPNDRFYSGTTDDNGFYYAAILDHTADDKIYKIDVTTTPPQVVETITMDRSLFFWDFVYINGYFYALETVGGASDHLIKIGLDGSIVQIGDATQKLTDYDFGSVFTDSTGSFYAIDDSGKGFFRIDLETVAVTHLSDAMPSRLNDGASCANATITIDGYDYGDAPDTYLTTNAVGGPRHAIVSGGPMLGRSIDNDSDGAPTADASGDDARDLDDEDGVFISGLSLGQNSTLQVTTSQPNNVSVYLNAWIDFNADGDFNDSGEQITTNQVIARADSQATLSFLTPSNAQLGQTFARVRLSSVSGLGVGGTAIDGEVEDYVVTIEDAAETCASGMAGAGNYALGWWHNGSGGTALYQDRYWHDYPNSNTDSPPNDSSVIASAADEAYGSGIVGTINNYEMFVNGADTSSLSAAIAANDYVQYQFTTANFANDKYVSRFVNTVGSEHSPQAYPYEFAILVSEHSDFRNYVVAKQDIDRQDWNGSSPTWSGGSSFKIPEVMPDQFALIKPNTTYYVRVYIYNDSSTNAQGVEFDDFNIGMADCTNEGSISGMVYLDSNANDTYDAGTETGLNAITVSVLNETNGLTVATTTTAADGSYSLSNLDASLTYRLLVDDADTDLPSGSAIGTSNPISGVTVVANGTTANQNFGFDLSTTTQCPAGEVLVPIADQTGWSVVSVSSSSEGTGAEVIDNNVGTRWVSAMSGSMPQSIILDLGTAQDVDGMWYYPKQGDPNGILTSYRVEVSSDNVSYTVANIGSVSIQDVIPALIEFSAENIRYIKLVATGSSGGQYIDITELSPLACSSTVSAQPISIASCRSFDYFHTGHDHVNGGILPLKDFDKKWLTTMIPQGTTDTVAALNNVDAWSYSVMSGDVTGYQAGSAVGNWHNGFSSIADWITNSEDGEHLNTGSVDVLYRKDFSLDAADAFLTYLFSNMELNFFVENAVWDIVVNGTSLKSLPEYAGQLPSSGADDPYSYLGYIESKHVSMEILSSLLQNGNNNIVVHLKSDPNNQGFFAESTFNMACDGVDLSDAPASYGRALHGMSDANMYIGTTPADADTQFLDSLQADGDDNNNTDDEGGANITEVTQDEAVTLTINVSGNGYLQAWLDFNSNGVFDAGEQIATDLQDGSANDTDGSNNGSISVAFTVPSAATVGQSYLRIRWSSQAALGASDAASDGEVEDYAIQIKKKTNDPIGCSSLDGFDDAVAKSVSLTAGNLGSYSELWASAEATLMDGSRTISLGDGGAEGEGMTAGITGGLFSVSNTASSGAPLSLCYDAGGAGLAKNLSDIESFRIMYSENWHEQAARPVIPMTISMFDGTRTVSLGKDMVANAYASLGQEKGWANLTFDLDDFSGINFFDTTDVQRICISVDEQLEHDYTFADVHLENSSCSVEYDLRLDNRLADGQDKTVNPGEAVTFTLEVTNEGASTATDIRLVDYIPASLTLNDSNWTQNGEQAIWNQSIPSLTPGNTFSVDIQFIANTELRKAGTRFSGNIINDEGECKNVAEIMSFAELVDIDSVPDNIDGNDISEDDYNLATVNINGLCQGQYDFGDAPDEAVGTSKGNYQTQISDNGARHRASDLLYLGSCVDTDDGDAQNNMADADDTGVTNNQTFGTCASANDDEDGLIAPLLSNNATAPTLNVTVFNDSGNDATLSCWVDYNGDGVFDNTTERGSATVASTGSAQVVNVILPDVPSTAAFDTEGTTYLRCRVASSNGADNAYGSAADGEVEDYQVTIQGHCTLTANISNVQCDNKGTADDSDDTWSFDVLANASGVGGNTNWQVSGDLSGGGTYSALQTMPVGLVSGSSALDLLFSDTIDNSCKAVAQLDTPDACSGGCTLFVTAGTPTINDQGTVSANDDQLEVQVTVTGVTPSTAQWEALRDAGGSYVSLGTVTGNDTATLSVNVSDIMSVDPNGFSLRIRQVNYSDCFVDLYVSMPNTATLQVNKTVVGAAAPANWDFTVATPNCSLPASLINPDSVSGSGGLAEFVDLTVYANDGAFCLYDITENTQAGYTLDTVDSDPLDNVSLLVNQTKTVNVVNKEGLYVVVRNASIIEGHTGSKPLEFLLEITESSTRNATPVRACSSMTVDEKFNDDYVLGNWNQFDLDSDSCSWNLDSNKLNQRAEDYDDCTGLITHPIDSTQYNTTSDHYTLEVRVESNYNNTIANWHDNSGVGIVFGFINTDNYYLARWYNYGYLHWSYSDYRRLQIVKVVDGEQQIIAQQKFTLPENFDLQVKVDDGGIEVLVDDGSKLLVTTERPILHGFGLYSHSNDDGIKYNNFVAVTHCPAEPPLPTSVNNVEVSYEVSDSSASEAEGDYSVVSGKVTIPAGENYINVPVQIHGDTRIEGDETFTIRLTEIINGQLVNTEATGTIIDDDFPILSVSDVSHLEGHTGTTAFVVNFTLDHPALAGGLSFDYQTQDGTATTADNDYQAANGTITIAEGDNSASVTIYGNGDTTVEGDETLDVILSNAVNVTLGDPAALLTIVNDDALVTPNITISDVSNLEGHTGITEFAVVVSLSSPAPAGGVSVDYISSDGTATTVNNDYQTASGTLTIAEGATQGTIIVNGVGDLVIENDETLTVTISNPVNGVITDNQATLTIINDDSSAVEVPNCAQIVLVDQASLMPTQSSDCVTIPRSEPVALVSVADQSVLEGDSGTVGMIFTVSLNAPAPAAGVSVNYATAPNTATTDVDFQTTTGTLNISSGQSSGTITVNVNGDTDVESDETLTLTLSSAINAVISDGTAVGTIIDDDVSVPSITVTDNGVVEGHTGTTQLNFTVTLSEAAPAGGVSVDYATSDLVALISDSDYQLGSGTLTIPQGSSSGVITVLINGDTKVEDNETFLLTLSNPVNADVAISQAVGTIINDDTVASCSQDVTLLNSATVSATGSGATGVPSITALHVPEGDNRVIMVLATFEREHCDAVGCNDDSSSPELGQNFAIPGTHSRDFQVTARFTGDGGVMDMQNPMVLPEGDLRFFNQYGYLVTGGVNSETTYASREAVFIALYESDITTLLGGQSEGNVSINLPDIQLPKDTADDAILMAYVFENVEQSTAGVVRSGVNGGDANYLGGDDAGVAGNYAISVNSLDAGQSPDHAQDGLLVFAVSGVGGSSISGQPFETMSGFTALDSVVTDNANGHYANFNEADGYSAMTQFANGIRNAFSVTSTAPSSMVVNGGAVAAFTLSCVVDGTNAPQPVAEYRFDECEWNGSNNEIIDSSGYHLNGQSQSGAFNTVYGKFNRAGNFDGSNDYINVADDAKLRITRDLTLAMWVYPEHIDSNQTFIYKDHNHEFELFVRSNTQLRFRHGDGEAESITLSSPLLSENTWAHIAMVRDYSEQQIHWYIDGQLVGTSDYHSDDITDDSNPLKIGKRGNNQAFDGVLDEVKIFNQALSVTDVQQMYDNESAGYNFDGTLRATPHCDPAFETRTSVSALEPEADGTLTFSTVWVNEGIAGEPYVQITAEVPYGTIFVPMEAGTSVTIDGVYCNADGESEGVCYYEAPSDDFPQGRVVWEGTIQSESGSPTRTRSSMRSELIGVREASVLSDIEQTAEHEVVLSFRVIPNGTTDLISAQAYSDWYYEGEGDATIDDRQNAVDSEASLLGQPSEITINSQDYAGKTQPIPTLSEWAMMLLSLLMMSFVWHRQRRKG